MSLLLLFAPGALPSVPTTVGAFSDSAFSEGPFSGILTPATTIDGMAWHVSWDSANRLIQKDIDQPILVYAAPPVVQTTPYAIDPDWEPGTFRRLTLDAPSPGVFVPAKIISTIDPDWEPGTFRRFVPDAPASPLIVPPKKIILAADAPWQTATKTTQQPPETPGRFVSYAIVSGIAWHAAWDQAQKRVSQPPVEAIIPPSYPKFVSIAWQSPWDSATRKIIQPPGEIWAPASFVATVSVAAWNSAWEGIAKRAFIAPEQAPVFARAPTVPASAWNSQWDSAKRALAQQSADAIFPPSPATPTVVSVNTWNYQWDMQSSRQFSPNPGSITGNFTPFVRFVPVHPAALFVVGF